MFLRKFTTLFKIYLFHFFKPRARSIQLGNEKRRFLKVFLIGSTTLDWATTKPILSPMDLITWISLAVTSWPDRIWKQLELSMTRTLPIWLMLCKRKDFLKVSFNLKALNGVTQNLWMLPKFQLKSFKWRHANLWIQMTSRKVMNAP